MHFWRCREAELLEVWPQHGALFFACGRAFSRAPTPTSVLSRIKPTLGNLWVLRAPKDKYKPPYVDVGPHIKPTLIVMVMRAIRNGGRSELIVMERDEQLCTQEDSLHSAISKPWKKPCFQTMDLAPFSSKIMLEFTLWRPQRTFPGAARSLDS